MIQYSCILPKDIMNKQRKSIHYELTFFVLDVV